jgi:hypothetical protein
LGGTVSFLTRLHDKGPRLASPIDFPNLVLSAPTGSLSHYFQIKGELLAFNQGGLAGIHSLLAAKDCLERGRALVAVVTSAEELSPARQRFFEILHGEQTLGEGAAALCLSCTGPGRARVSGIGLSGQAGDKGVAQAVSLAMREAKLTTVDRVLGAAMDSVGSQSLDLTPQIGYSEMLSVFALGFAGERIAENEIGSALIVARDASGAAAVVLTR